MRKDNFKILGGILVLISILVFVMWRSGVIESYWFSWGILQTIAVSSYIFYVLRTEYQVSTRATIVMATIVGLALLPLLLPILLSVFIKAAPLTARALSIRAVDSDLKVSEVTQPIGTGMKVAAKSYRDQREEQITRWYEEALVSLETKRGKTECWGWDEGKKISIKVVCTEALLVKDALQQTETKVRNLKAVQEIKPDFSEPKTAGPPRPQRSLSTVKVDWNWFNDKLSDPTIGLPILLFVSLLVFLGTRKPSHHSGPS